MKSFLPPLLKALALVAALVAAAAWPAHALWGGMGLLAFAVAAGASLVGFALGRLPHLLLTQGSDALFHAALAGLGARLLGTLAIAAPLMILSGLPLTPFAVGLLLSYLALLVLEVVDLVQASHRLEAGRAQSATGPQDEALSAPDGVDTP